ncbi:MAG: NAD(P)/FAD-dependent oxidoreductase [Planctomycetes bacterium]|nr:NAD(P)/FAD-dependent oxidoreductase [Planctomycetota bacterium]
MSDGRRDVIVIGAGAAGIFAALAARGALDAKGAFAVPGPGAPSVLLLDGKERPGRKILVSGGGRCNVTNVLVRDRDYDTDAPAVVRGTLAGFPVASVREFFRSRGVHLAEEPVGKLFPVEGGAKAVLAALFAALEEAGVERAFGAEAGAVARDGEGWLVDGRPARRIVIATGGKSVPATGSTGFAYGLAAGLGHAVVETVPALAALRCGTPERLAGVTVPAILTVEDGEGRALGRSAGSLLFTHGGVSGPAALDASLWWARARRGAEGCRVRADFWTLADPSGPWGGFLRLAKAPGSCMADPPSPADPRAVEEFLLAAARRMPKGTAGTALAERVPRRLLECLVRGEGTPLSRLTREERRAAGEALCRLDLGVLGSEGFAKAEVTAGGVPLRELDRRTLESRLAPGLHFCGEACHATGRLGGFNFQWAWSSGFAAGRGAGAAAMGAG